jgi:hypothetical protein
MATVRSATNMFIPRDKPPDELRVAVDAFLSQPGLSP